MKTEACKGCGKQIVWAKSREGKNIPLDPTPAVYSVHQGTEAIFADREPASMVSHFATCPKASDFSGTKKKVAGLLLLVMMLRVYWTPPFGTQQHGLFVCPAYSTGPQTNILVAKDNGKMEVVGSALVEKMEWVDFQPPKVKEAGQ